MRVWNDKNIQQTYKGFDIIKITQPLYICLNINVWLLTLCQIFKANYLKESLINTRVMNHLS